MNYQPPRWLGGAHAQTIWPALALKPARPAYRRTFWDTPDGGRIALDFVDGQDGQPLVVLFHGLEGNSDSHYARALMLQVQARGWNGVVPHFRGCAGVENRLPRAYHAGDAAEIRWILQKLAIGNQTLLATGFSLGASMLLNYLAEEGPQALPTAAAAVSAPLDLEAASRCLDHGFNRMVYTRMFLRTLKAKAIAQLRHHPGLFDAQAILRAKTFADFDQLVTAPLHGFSSAHSYWRQSSSKQRLLKITCPTLILNARNDPFLPEQALPGRHQVSAAIELDFPPQGGHVGFVSGSFPGNLDWMPLRLLRFFEQHG
jgi:predicted alpha/beta-fold hydrolase